MIDLEGKIRVGREVKGGHGFRARVGNMSSGTCMHEEEAKEGEKTRLNSRLSLVYSFC